LAGVLALGSLLGQQVWNPSQYNCLKKYAKVEHTLVNVGQDTTLGDCDVTQQLVQLLIVADGELKMTRDDTGLLVVTSGVASKFEDFSRKVFKDSSQVDWSTSTDTLSVVALSQETVDTTDRECETGL
jgi:hypothetical protein